MSIPLGPAVTPRDALVRQVDRVLSRVAAALVVLLIPVGLARLPHAIELGLAVIGLHGIALLFNRIVWLGQRLGIFGPDALDPSSPERPLEDPAVPIRATAPPIAVPAAATPALDRLQVDAAALRHSVDVPGRGRVLYWSAERELGAGTDRGAKNPALEIEGSGAEVQRVVEHLAPE